MLHAATGLKRWILGGGLLVLLNVPLPVHAQAVGSVTGVVTEAGTQRPLAGVQVFLPGSGVGGLSNNQGRFVLLNAPAGSAVIRVEMIGYAPGEQTITITAGESTQVNFSLQPRAIAMNEIVATGQALATERRQIGNTLAVVDASRLAEVAPIRDFTEMLAGRSPGVSVLTNNGTVGTGGQILIRGVTSVTQTNKPLIYIDGIRADDSSSGLSVGGATPTRLTDINPHDIDRVEIVKGAAATTLYGTEGANGVVQIFTKRGRSGPAQWTALIEQGAERLMTSRFPGRLWTQFEGPSGFRARDPADIVKTGRSQNYQLSVGGGAEALSYYVSGGVQMQEGSVTPAVNHMDQVTTRVNLNTVVSPSLSIGVNTGYVRSDLRLPENDNALHGVYSQVVSGVPYTADEGRMWGERWGSHSINQTVETFQNVDRFTGGLRVDHKPGEGVFSQTLNFGLDWYGQLDEKFFPYGFRGSGNNLGAKTSQQRRVLNTTLDYRSGFSHEFNPNFTAQLSGGFQANFYRAHITQSSGTEYPAPGLRTVGATTIRTGTENWTEETNAGFFTQLGVGLYDKVFLTAGVRFDGNSAFGEDFPFKSYPKVSVAYNISDEAFWPRHLAETLKLRAAWGTAGRAPAQFAADRTFSPVAAEDGKPAVTPSNVGDPNLGPETSQELEVGFDAGLFGDRIGLEFTYYSSVTRDALVQKRYPPSMGFTATQLANVGEIENKGWEMAIRGLLLTSERLDWDAHFQISTTSNVVTSLGGQPSFAAGNATRIEEGYPATGKWVRKSSHWDPVTRRHVPLLTESGGLLHYVGDATPKWRGSLNSSLRIFNNLTLTGQAEWATGMIGVNFARGWAIGKLTGDEYLALVEKPRGTRTPASDSLYNLWQVVGDGGFVEKADWLKLREVSVAYRLPEAWLGRFGFRDTNIRVSARNLGLWAPDWSGPDPEVKYGGSAGDLNIGYDFNTMPIPRRISISLRTGW